MSRTVVAFGELLWDLLPEQTILGGAPFNFIARIHSLGDTGLMISRIGDDDPGRGALERIRQLGLDTRLIQRDDRFPTGTVEVRFDHLKNPDYVIIPDVAYDHIEIDEPMLQAVSQADCFCFGTLSQRAECSRRTLRQLLEAASGALKLVDLNLRKRCYSAETVRWSIDQADVLKLNEDEMPQTAQLIGMAYADIPEFCSRIMDAHDLTYCLVTLGEEGVFAASRDGGRVYDPGYRVPLADSLGSGDAFSAGFVHKLLHGDPMPAACAFGNRLGAVVASKSGATAPVALLEIENLKADGDRNLRMDLESYTASMQEIMK